MLSTQTFAIDSTGVTKTVQNWFPFDGILRHATDEIGVYIIRTRGGTRLIPRETGSSDIVYIGQTTDSFRNRFKKYVNPPKKDWTCIRVNEYSKRYELEVGFIPVDRPEFCEFSLFTVYEGDHYELPPLNNKDSREFYPNLLI